jgi:hypothetical protein
MTPSGSRQEHAMPRYLGPFEIDGRPTPTGSKKWFPASYEQAVYDVLEQIAKTQTGWAVVEQISRMNIRIQPEPEHSGIGAAANGAGTVFFTPGKYIKGYVLYQANPSGIGYAPDEVLLHELFHAMRKLTDTESPDIPSGLSLPSGEQKKIFPKGLELSEGKKTGMDGAEYTVTEMAIHLMVEFLRKHDRTRESFAFFAVAIVKLRQKLGNKNFKALLNGRVLTAAVAPDSTQGVTN